MQLASNQAGTGLSNRARLSQDTRARGRDLAACFARVLEVSSPSRQKGRREGRAPAGTRQDPRAEQMHTQCTGETQGSRNQAFPARWFDGLCRALPGADHSFWPPSPRGLDDAVCPVGLAGISATGLTVATTARTTRFRRTRGGAVRLCGPRMLTRFISPCTRKLHL